MSPAFGMPPAAQEVVIHHAGRLTKGINDGRAAEIEAFAL
jgi:hypothetical protein